MGPLEILQKPQSPNAGSIGDHLTTYVFLQIMDAQVWDVGLETWTLNS